MIGKINWQGHFRKVEGEKEVDWIKNYYHITDDGKHVLRAKQACCGGKYLWSVGKLTALREETIKQGEAFDADSAKYAAENAYKTLTTHREIPHISRVVTIGVPES